MKNLIWIYLILIGLCIEEAQPERRSLFEIDKKTNFVDNFDLQFVRDFVKSKKYVMVLFHNENKNFKKLHTFLFTLSTIFEEKEVFFLQVNVKSHPSFILKQLNLELVPSYKFYIYGLEKNYTLGLDIETCKRWITQVIESEVQTIVHINEIPDFDLHYILHANQEVIKQNPAHFKVLAKIISPISIFTGLNEAQISNLTERESVSGSLFAYRKYDKQLFQIVSNMTIIEKAQYIREREFPDFLLCSDSAKDLIIKQKIPVLIYFTDGKNPENKQMILETSQVYLSYFKLLIVDWEKNDECNNFFRLFLATRHQESVKLLTLHDTVKRYSFVGKFERPSIRFFLRNYIQNNLKPFRIQEDLSGNPNYRGILKANYITYQRNVKRRHIIGLYYLYSKDSDEFEKHVSELRIIKSVFRRNKLFKVFLLDHRKNDLDGYLHERTPFIFLIPFLGNIEYFEQNISADNLVRFITTKIPVLKLSEPDLAQPFDGDL